MADTDLKSFTSRKLELQNALMLDSRLSAAQRVVAVALLSHANAETGAIFPSQDLIAVETGYSARHVRNCIKILEQAGWLEVQRSNRQLSNRYAFRTEFIGAIQDQHIIVKEALADRRERQKAERNKQPDRNSSSSQKLADRNSSSAPERNPSSSEHLKVTPPSMGLEGNALIEAVTNSNLVVASEVAAPSYHPQPSDGYGEGLAQSATQAASKQALPAPANDAKPRTIHDELAEGRVYQAQWPLRSQGGMGGRPYVDPTPIFDRIEAEMRGRRK